VAKWPVRARRAKAVLGIADAKHGLRWVLLFSSFYTILMTFELTLLYCIFMSFVVSPFKEIAYSIDNVDHHELIMQTTIAKNTVIECIFFISQIT
jgi:hypothetical protein